MPGSPPYAKSESHNPGSEQAAWVGANATCLAQPGAVKTDSGLSLEAGCQCTTPWADSRKLGLNQLGNGSGDGIGLDRFGQVELKAAV